MKSRELEIFPSEVTPYQHISSAAPMRNRLSWLNDNVNKYRLRYELLITKLDKEVFMVTNEQQECLSIQPTMDDALYYISVN